MTHPNGTVFEEVKNYWFDKSLSIKAGMLCFYFAKGVRITYPDGTKRWISDTWYDEETLKELFER